MVPTIFLGTAFGKIGRFFFFPFWRLGDYPYCSCRDNIKFGITYIFVMVIVNCACYVTWMFWLISLAPSVLHAYIYISKIYIEKVFILYFLWLVVEGKIQVTRGKCRPRLCLQKFRKWVLSLLVDWVNGEDLRWIQSLFLLNQIVHEIIAKRSMLSWIP